MNEGYVCGRRSRAAAAAAAMPHHLSCPHINTNIHSPPSMSSLYIPRITRRLLYLSVCGRAGDCCTGQTDDETKAGEKLTIWCQRMVELIGGNGVWVVL